jgi:protocatechuate 3,4-dioxygenase beta subunit
VHYKAHKRGYFELTTQLYFEGDPYNNADKILQSLPRSEQEKVVRPITVLTNGDKVVTFNLTIEKA